MRRLTSCLLFAIAVLGCVSAAACGSVAKPRSRESQPPLFESLAPPGRTPGFISHAVAVRAMRSVARITCTTTYGEYLGTGFATDAGVVTAAHAVSACAGPRDHVVIKFPYPRGQQILYRTHVTKIDRLHDLALLPGRPALRSRILSLARSQPRIGEIVDLIGFPGLDDIRPVADYGPITPVEQRQLVRLPSGQETLPNALVIVISGNKEGESGGPGINAAGRVVGVIEAGGGGVADLTPAAEMRALR